MLTFILLAVLIFAVYYRFFRVLGYWKSKNVVGPKPDYVFGHFKSFVFRQKSSATISRDLYEMYPDEKFIGIYEMTTPCLMLRDLDIIQHVMIKDFDNFTDRGIELSKSGLGLNLFHTDGDTWRVLRNRFSPMFSAGKLRKMTYLLAERGEKIVEYVDLRVRKEKEQEIHNITQKYAISSIFACVFGLDIEMDSKYFRQLDAIDGLIFTNTYSFALLMLFPSVFKLFNSDMFPSAVTDFFYKLVKEIIADRTGQESTRHDFMDLLLEMRRMGNIKSTKVSEDNKELNLEITDIVLTAQAFVFYTAGYETTAMTLSYLFYELAMHPEIQEQVVEEIDRVLEINDNQLNYDTLKQMKYLGKVFDETLRLHPVVEPLLRKSLTKYKIPDSDLTIDKGQIIHISAFGIHYDEKYYPNPLVFDPERFTPEKIKNRHPCAYMPFGVGPRNCIGLHFAKTQGRVCVVKLLSKYRVAISVNTPRNLVFNPLRRVMYPRGGIPLKFIPRTDKK